MTEEGFRNCAEKLGRFFDMIPGWLDKMEYRFEVGGITNVPPKQARKFRKQLKRCLRKL